MNTPLADLSPARQRTVLLLGGILERVGNGLADAGEQLHFPVPGVVATGEVISA